MKPTLYMMVGIVGSGKSTQAQTISSQVKYCTVVSSDEIREELFNDVNSQADNNLVFNEVHKRIIDRLKSGKSVVFDATNINSKKRQSFLKQIEHIDCLRIAVAMVTPIEECVKRNSERERVVPAFVIDRMYKSFEMPHAFEGFDLVIPYGRNLDEQKGKALHQLVTIAKTTRDVDDMFKSYGKLFNMEEYNVPQDNPHHTLKVIEHCIETGLNVSDETAYFPVGEIEPRHSDLALVIAGLFHDVSKYKVKSMLDKEGNISEKATFYQHHCVSAYDTMCMLMQTNAPLQTIVEVTALITHHMRLHTTKEQTGIDNFKIRVGYDFFNRLEILRKADEKGKYKTH